MWSGQAVPGAGPVVGSVMTADGRRMVDPETDSIVVAVAEVATERDVEAMPAGMNAI